MKYRQRRGNGGENNAKDMSKLQLTIKLNLNNDYAWFCTGISSLMICVRRQIGYRIKLQFNGGSKRLLGECMFKKAMLFEPSRVKQGSDDGCIRRIVSSVGGDGRKQSLGNGTPSLSSKFVQYAMISVVGFRWGLHLTLISVA